VAGGYSIAGVRQRAGSATSGFQAKKSGDGVFFATGESGKTSPSSLFDPVAKRSLMDEHATDPLRLNNLFGLPLDITNPVSHL
jgi:hypothetical protein